MLRGMPNYRRAFRPGGSFFFTVVTADRAPILITNTAIGILRKAVAECGRRWPFAFDAGVVLPDHLHAIWTLPPGDHDFSRRWAWIKRTFSSRYLAAGGAERAVMPGQKRQRRRGIWQPRFYEHCIRDMEDLNNHLDYIHYNPVKHGLVGCPHAWPYSSFGRWVARRGYDADWLCTCSGAAVTPPRFDWIAGRSIE